jgi:hypothetical protein
MGRARSSKRARHESGRSVARSIAWGLKWVAISLAGVVGVTTVAFFTHEIIGDAALRAFPDNAAPIGWWLTIGAVQTAEMTGLTRRRRSVEWELRGSVASSLELLRLTIAVVAYPRK